MTVFSSLNWRLGYLLRVIKLTFRLNKYRIVTTDMKWENGMS